MDQGRRDTPESTTSQVECRRLSVVGSVSSFGEARGSSSAIGSHSGSGAGLHVHSLGMRGVAAPDHVNGVRRRR